MCRTPDDDNIELLRDLDQRPSIPADTECDDPLPSGPLRLNSMRYAEKTSLASHMLCTAELLLGETVVTTGSCMLDTGALEASFISQSMIDSSPLFAPLLTPCSIAVTLGDGKEEKGVYVTSYIQLTVRIPILEEHRTRHLPFGYWSCQRLRWTS